METKKELVNSPAHYSAGGIECIDAMVAAHGAEKVFNFCVLNAIKYLWRCGKKDAAAQELEKARWYINKALELI